MMKIDQTEELINTLDPNLVQCVVCKKWFDRDLYQFEIVINRFFVCCTCDACFRKVSEKTAKKIRIKYHSVSNKQYRRTNQ